MFALAYERHRPAYLQASESLNERQRLVYESTANTVVLAGPGSGKTKTLTLKLARMLREDVAAPRGIACITYSSECARELKRRLDELGVLEGPDVHVGTVHGFCLQHIVKPYGRLAGIPLTWPIRVPEQKQARQLFSDAIEGVGIRQKPSNLRVPFDKYRRTHLDRSSTAFLADDPSLATLVLEYESRLTAEGYIDFDGMVRFGLQLVAGHEWVRRAIKAKFPILVVDEYQDLGLALDQIVRGLCFDSGVRLLAVGDPDQSIYGFTGADPRLLRQLAKDPRVTAVRLRLNYRCGRTIVAGSVAALGEKRDYEAASVHEGEISFWKCDAGALEQVATIFDTIIPRALQSKPGRTLGDIAILYMDRNDATRLTAAAKAAGYQYVGGDKEARYPATPLTRWVEDCAAWCAGGWRHGTPRLRELIAFWHRLHDDDVRQSHRESLDRQRAFVSFLWRHRDPDVLVLPWLDGFLAAGLAKAVKATNDRADERDALRELYRAAKDSARLGGHSVADLGGLRGTSAHLNLSTLHSSKGLEFDVVIIQGLDQGRLPKWSSTSPEKVAEDRRLFYVGVTRARDEVHCVYSGWYQDHFGRPHRDGVSQFVAELQRVE